MKPWIHSLTASFLCYACSLVKYSDCQARPWCVSVSKTGSLVGGEGNTIARYLNGAPHCSSADHDASIRRSNDDTQFASAHYNLKGSQQPLVYPEELKASHTNSPSIEVVAVRFAQKWDTIDGVKAQIVEIKIANTEKHQTLNTSITSAHTVNLVGNGITTRQNGSLYRLVAGDEVVVSVLVSTSSSKGAVIVEVRNSSGDIVLRSKNWPIAPLRTSWPKDNTVLNTHESPQWFNDAKYGIFIHWGPYSVPAWAPSHVYAEWYGYSLHDTPHDERNPTYAHHKKKFGKHVVYDDFIAKFTGEKFNPTEWLNLFDDAGAKYFVFVTKHHDGYALFDTGNTSNRNSLKLGPKRDFLDELFTAAIAHKPDLRRGTYFTMPEWFNPDYKKYGWGAFPGGPIKNPFTGKDEPFTGRVPIDDYLTDLQLPQQLTLIEKYGTEIMWCDIGGANLYADMASHYYNYAWSQGRQVTVDNRCGDAADFDTPEYERFSEIHERKWETTEGMDPWSFGLNKATPDEHYKNATTIITKLVDIVSKNGNYLLDVGPNAAGEIIPAMADNLREAGAWLKYGGPCVYNTRYWHKGAEDSSGTVRFLQTPTTFCIVSLKKPTGGNLTVDTTTPILPGDTIQLLGGPKRELPWSISKGKLSITVSDDDLNSVQFAWAFQVTYAVR
ncbi:glycoside hydrolase [Rickenella mellea]|uniref:alpha-L-fucosidase n=1 Tax=Rickenella mellea TaxID=50990 RepID=A0A4Y7Q2V6_9AGAM|nr:glycoside hydrolase [Rickenella mellea]